MTKSHVDQSYASLRVRHLPQSFRNATLAAIIAGLATALCTASNNAVAAPLNYIESINGELPFFSDPSFTLPLDLGINTVSGQFIAGGLEPDFDSFAFLVPAGIQLVSLQVSLADIAGGDLMSTDWRIEAGSATSFAGAFVEFLLANSPGIDVLDNVLLSANVYSLTQTSNHVFDPPSTANFTFTFVVVPEPATSTLLLLGAISAFFSRHPKRAAIALQNHE